MKPPQESFAGIRSVLVSMIDECLNTIHTEKEINPVNYDKSLNSDGTPFTTIVREQVFTINITYKGARWIVRHNGRDVDIDPDRTIKIAIGASKDWSPIVLVMSSISDHQRQISNGNEAEIKQAIKTTHDEVFHKWPLGNDEIQRLMDEIPPDEP